VLLILTSGKRVRDCLYEFSQRLCYLPELGTIEAFGKEGYRTVRCAIRGVLEGRRIWEGVGSIPTAGV